MKTRRCWYVDIIEGKVTVFKGFFHRFGMDSEVIQGETLLVRQWSMAIVEDHKTGQLRSFPVEAVFFKQPDLKIEEDEQENTGS